MENQTVASKIISLDLKEEMLSTETIIIWLIVIETFSILIVVLNFGTILTFLLNRYLRRRSVYSLINLAVADMLYGLSVIPYSVYHLVFQLLNPSLELHSTTAFALTVVMEVMFLASLISLIAVPLERVFATFFPFRYRTVKSIFFMKAFSSIWLLSLLLVIPYQISSFFGYNSWLNPYTFFIFDLVLLGVAILSYIAIFIKLKLQNKRCRQIQHQGTVELAQKRERHIAKSLLFVKVLSLSTWLPYLIFELVQLSNPQRSLGFSTRLVIELIQLFNSLINPLVCLLRMEGFRKSFFKLICKCCHGNQRIHPSSNVENPIQCNELGPNTGLKFRN